MRYARYRIDGEARFGLVVDDFFLDLVAAAEAHGTAAQLDGFRADDTAPRWIARGNAGHDAARAIAAAVPEEALRTPGAEVAGVHAIADLELLAPIARPGKIVAVGRNYADHCAEQNQEPPKKPMFFVKLGTSVLDPGGTIRFRRDVTDKVDYEAELAIVIGRAGRDITPERAMDHVYGYTVVNDVTARDLQKSDKQWARAKGLDTFCPMGPCIVTADEITDPHDLDVRSFVNGEPRQNSNTRHLIFDIPTLVSRLSQSVTLEPGDVIPTGTPGGVGCYLDPPVFLADGDEVRVEVVGIGSITNRVAEESAP